MLCFYKLCLLCVFLSLPVVHGLQDLGFSCRSNDECSSGHCIKAWHTFWTTGVCHECTNDDDCDGRGISRPGELPAAFCYKQKGDLNICSPWQRGKPVGEEGYPIHLPGSDPAWVRRFRHEGRSNIDYEPAMSQVWRFDLSNQPGGALVEINVTHVRIPLYTELLAGYSRTYHALNDEHETGIVTALFLHNPYSVVTSRGHSAMLEKYHTLTYDGELPTPKADRIKRELASRSVKDGKRAEEQYERRSLEMISSVIPTKVIDSLIEAGQDQVHWESVRSYANQRKKKGLVTNMDDRLWLPIHRSVEAKEATEVHAKSKPSMKSENHCKHFEDGYGIALTETHIEIPLYSPWITVSGEMNFSPNYYMGLNNGINIARYDANANALEFHYQAYQQWRHYVEPSSDANPSSPSGLFLAPISPDYPVASVDGRSDQYYKAESSWYSGILANYMNIPTDYSLYDRSATCNERTREELSDKWDDAKLEQAQVQDTDNVFEDLLDLHSLVTVAVDGASCASTFMRADYGPNSTGLEVLEFTAWVHLILEADPDVTEFLASATFWDDWDHFYKMH